MQRVLQSIERLLGRPDERERNAPRPLDLDILYADDLMIDDDVLTLRDMAKVLSPLMVAGRRLERRSALLSDVVHVFADLERALTDCKPLTGPGRAAKELLLDVTLPERGARLITDLHRLAGALDPRVDRETRRRLLDEGAIDAAVYVVKHLRLTEPPARGDGRGGGGGAMTQREWVAQQCAASRSVEDLERSLREELLKYRDSRDIRELDERGVLGVWADMHAGNGALLLPLVAMAVCSPPPTTAVLESSFSSVSNITGPKRRRMLPATIDARLLVDAKFRADEPWDSDDEEDSCEFEPLPPPAPCLRRTTWWRPLRRTRRTSRR